jgi:hypothetical protein
MGKKSAAAILARSLVNIGEKEQLAREIALEYEAIRQNFLEANRNRRNIALILTYMVAFFCVFFLMLSALCLGVELLYLSLASLSLLGLQIYLTNRGLAWLNQEGRGDSKK